MNTIWVTHTHKHNSQSLVSVGATSSGDNTYPKHFDCWPLFGSLTSICIRKVSVALCNQTFYIMFLQWCAWMIVQCNKPKQVCASFRAQGRERLTEAQMWAKQLRLRLTDLTKKPPAFRRRVRFSLKCLTRLFQTTSHETVWHFVLTSSVLSRWTQTW